LNNFRFAPVIQISITYHRESRRAGKPKVEAIKNYIISRNCEAEVHTFCEKINSVDDLDRILAGDLKPDAIVGCADTPPVAIHTFIIEYCLKNDGICTFGGLGIHHGHVGPLLVENSHQHYW
jgi:tRNA A37 threonylcarbamoyladenosine dehydratase